jgi:hypothetical protein
VNFKQALKAKEKNIHAEYQMRAARIVGWLIEQNEITEEESEEVYNSLWNDISKSDDEYDQIALDIVEEIRDEKKGKK